MSLDTSTPVLLLGGQENSLAVVRHLGRLGIRVSVSGAPACWGMHSRFCHKQYPIARGQDPSRYWHELLLSPRRKELDGHIIFSCNDDAIDFLATYRQELVGRYILDDAVPEIQRAMLDKKKTLELARDAGVPTPNFWNIDTDEDVLRLRDGVMFPVMVKPIHSHKFQRAFGRKLFIIEDSLDELKEKVALARAHDLAVMVVEMVPGPDDRLSSYYTYMDASGRHLFHFTKRILRRYPVNQGRACYHITEWLPETAALGQRFFDSIGFRGMGNIEFKRDDRDGKLKVIEVNPRLTAAQVLVANSGMPIDLIIYCHLTGQSVPAFSGYEQMRRLWYPFSDFGAFLDLRQRGELSFNEWIGSIFHRKMDFPVHDWSDPGPGVAVLAKAFSKGWRR